MTTVGTKIERKIASNGVEMFFAIDKNGKKHRITREDATIPYAYQVREQYEAERKARREAAIDAIEDYAVSTEAQDVAVDAEIEQAAATVDETEVDPVETAISNMHDDELETETRERFAPYKAEFNAAIKGIYLDDLSGGYEENPAIIPAIDLLQFVIPLALTDHSEHAYRKNPDGTFTEDKAAFNRLEEVEAEMFNASGHKIGIDNLDYEVDKLTAEFAEAKEISRQRYAELCAAQVAADKAADITQEKYSALYNLGSSRAEKLREKFLRTGNVASDMMIQNQDGFSTIPYLSSTWISFNVTEAGNSISIACDESEGSRFILARYKTFKQAENAINLFADAVNRGDKKFTFPADEFSFNVQRFAKPDDKLIELAKSVAESMNAQAPTGWAVLYDTKENEYQIMTPETVNHVDTITAGDYLNPKEFFKQFEPDGKSPEEIFLDDRYRELAELEEMREEIARDYPHEVERIETLDEMIDEAKREIAEVEFGKRDTVENACKAGAVDEDGYIYF
ncbi:MAG: hypothetical protein IJ774_05395 [Selenomonadaceae bacterium]|nr:hypothetical protein [Selenomonadaceae bacterium]MBR1805809.1 hypothetical protein [Selenomonadaceae bacterium]